MTTDNFTPHDGGKCPVANGTLIDVQYRSGVIALKIPALKYLAGKSCATDWEHSYCSYDIIGWRLAEQPKQENEPVYQVYLEMDDVWLDVSLEIYKSNSGTKRIMCYRTPEIAAIIAKLEAEKVALIEALKKIKQLLQE